MRMNPKNEYSEGQWNQRRHHPNAPASKNTMNHNADNFDRDLDPDFDAGEPDLEGGSEREFTSNNEPSGPNATDATHDLGPEWFDPRWLRANGAIFNEDGSIIRVNSPTMVMVGAPADAASPGEEMDVVLCAFGMLAWPRVRSTRVGTLLEQMQSAKTARREWLRENPFAAFWAATARTGPRRRRISPRRP